MNETFVGAAFKKPVVSVSVIIPVFNAVATIQRAVASVVSQTHQPIEVIVVDDGSTDGTREELLRLQASLPEGWFKVIRLDVNQGPASARNAGWEAATQEYLAFLDSDDAWHSAKLEVQYRWMSEHPLFVLSGHRCEVSTPNEWVAQQSSTVPVRYYNFWDFVRSNRFSTPSVMLKRSIEFRFEAGKRYSEDYLLWMIIVFKTGEAAYIDRTLTHLFKAKYGASGLSGQMFRMELGELESYLTLFKENTLSASQFCAACLRSILKFLRRYALNLCGSV